MRPFLVMVLLAASACPSGPPPAPEVEVTPFAISVPAGSMCTDVLEVPEASDTVHVTSEAEFNHNTNPPTSGRHFTEWFNAGVYPDPVPDGNQVHNLEHGHVVVQYDDVTDEELAAIRAPVMADPFMMLMAPRPGMEWKLALTAWMRIQVCTEIPEDVGALVRAFVVENRDSDLAPESVP